MKMGLNGDDQIFTARRYEPVPDGAAPEGSGPPKVRIKRLDEFLAEYEPLSYLLEPIVRTSSLYTLTARTGAGKTAWLISVALAIATGRDDILGTEVPHGRVVFLTFENPDDVRMRIKVAAYLLNIDVRSISDWLLVVDMRTSPEAVLAELQSEGQFALIIVDTLAAMYDGDDINAPVQAGNFLRRLRPLTKLPGSPATIVAAHPIKNAEKDQLIPYGSGAILNEVDGNLTLWRRSETGTVELHWQGKLRGLEFQPVAFRFELSSSPEVLDAKGREISLPTMLPARLSEADEDVRTEAEADTSIALLKAMIASPRGTHRQWADDIGKSKALVTKRLLALKTEKLVDNIMGRWSVTPKAEREVEKWA